MSKFGMCIQVNISAKEVKLNLLMLLLRFHFENNNFYDHPYYSLPFIHFVEGASDIFNHLHLLYHLLFSS